jgi:hypothetical protein
MKSNFLVAQVYTVPAKIFQQSLSFFNIYTCSPTSDWCRMSTAASLLVPWKRSNRPSFPRREADWIMLCSHIICHEQSCSDVTYAISSFSIMLVVTCCLRSKTKEPRKFLILGLKVLCLMCNFDIRCLASSYIKAFPSFLCISYCWRRRLQYKPKQNTSACPQHGDCNVPWKMSVPSSYDSAKLRKLTLHINHRSWYSFITIPTIR